MARKLDGVNGVKEPPTVTRSTLNSRIKNMAEILHKCVRTGLIRLQDALTPVGAGSWMGRWNDPGGWFGPDDIAE